MWVTAADDDMIRVWGVDGQKMHQFAYSGGSVQALYVDEANKLLVASMLVRSAGGFIRSVAARQLLWCLRAAAVRLSRRVVRGGTSSRQAEGRVLPGWN